jgi:YfiH family protein
MEFSAPTSEHVHWMAEGRAGPIEVRFLGRGPSRDRAEALAAAGGGELEPAWCRQVHGNSCIQARPGECGEGDALVTDRPGIALSVATADCVPVVVGADHSLAVVHAGWRGIAAGVVAKAAAALRAGSSTAWIGPAIGPCCYEVDHDVARAVVEASDADVIVRRAAGKSYLSLQRAVAFQLRQAGVESISRVHDACTRCHAQGLHSYRREGQGAGRNLTFAWFSR